MRTLSINSISFFLSFLALTHTIGCGGDDARTASLAMRAVAEGGAGMETPLVMAAEDSTPFEVSAAQLHLRDIELDLPDDTLCEDLVEQPVGASCDQGEDKIRIAGPIIVDLVTGKATPNLSSVKIPTGTYQRIDFRVDDGDPEDGLVEAGSALDDRSLVVEASFTYQSTATQLQLSLKFNEDIRVERTGGVQVGEGQDLVTTWITEDWLRGVDVVGCLDDGDLMVNGGVVVLDDDAGGECSRAEGTIKDNMKNTLQLDSE